jgi:hypothetical protein
MLNCYYSFILIIPWQWKPIKTSSYIRQIFNYTFLIISTQKKLQQFGNSSPTPIAYLDLSNFILTYIYIYWVSKSHTHKLFMYMIFLRVTQFFLCKLDIIFYTNKIVRHQYCHHWHTSHNKHGMTQQLMKLPWLTNGNTLISPLMMFFFVINKRSRTGCTDNNGYL